MRDSSLQLATGLAALFFLLLRIRGRRTRKHAGDQP